MRKALIQGMENANKTGIRFGWVANGGLMEGVTVWPGWSVFDRCERGLWIQLGCWGTCSIWYLPTTESKIEKAETGEDLPPSIQ